MATIRQLRREATASLEIAGVDSPPHSVELLLLHALGRERAYLYAHPEATPTLEQVARFRELIARRAHGVPAQYLTGWQEFYGRAFAVSPEVLIPRPETELVVETSLRLIAGEQAPRIVDVGTGSGCLAITLALERSDAHVAAIEISRAALAVARANTRRLGARVNFIAGDLLSPFLPDGREPGRFDLVVANPPYIAAGDFPGLPREVRDFEPPAALLAGATGLEIYERLLPQARQVLAPGGWLVMEIGDRLGPGLRRLLGGWDAVEIGLDWQGLDRIALARRQ